ncbi:MAG: amino acid permease [Gammaproteobacteria bacterium]|nr:amino acid permease [Gammaproteobacteria bacterium]
MEQPTHHPVTLKRAFSLPLLTFYGLGTILGAGIYVLIGEVAGSAGMAAPLAFLLAAVLATFSALSYAELSARFPISAGEAIYAQQAFGHVGLSRLLGLLIVTIGVVSSATLVRGFVGYFQLYVPLADWLIIVLLVVLLGALAIKGIMESAWVAAATTLVEVAGLLLILLVAGERLAELPARLPELLPGASGVTALGIVAGAFVAFYAFVGFEDMVNVAEEVREPARTLPRAIVLSLVITTVLYLLVATVAVLTVSPAQLAASGAPLALVYAEATGREPHFIASIGLAAVINGALIQIIMASRVLYGMARQGWLPALLGEVHATTRTPLVTTLALATLILLAALWLPLITLAEVTSLITLGVFAMVNLSLWRIKGKEPLVAGVPLFPRWLPLCGFLFSLLFILFQLWHWLR